MTEWRARAARRLEGVGAVVVWWWWVVVGVWVGVVGWVVGVVGGWWWGGLWGW